MIHRTLDAALRFLLPVALLALAPAAAGAQAGSSAEAPEASGEPPAGEAVPSLDAVRLRGAPPRIDGDLSDPAWTEAPVATGFVQVEPHEGAPATERTEARVLYDDQALYVAFRAYDSRPDSIVAQLTRRDEMSHSDRVHVLVDSYFDRRTAFHFAVNPLGVKADLYRHGDVREDPGWDAVWEVATRTDSLGWTAEFRIPLSQLRFSDARAQSWGINFAREIARRNELSVWAPLSQQEEAVVSRSGILRDLRDLSPPRRLEIVPYTVARLTRAPGDPEDPFHDRNALEREVGADVKVGVTGGLTLDLTLNPDFGQVEADPSRVNLTAFETFLPERRPFFQEGAGIFRFPLGVGDGGDAESLFYSRRIGRAPQGSVGGNAEWVDRPSRTRILGAGKVSGRTEGGWSLGILGALTDGERARVVRSGEVGSDPVEPRTGYSVLRLQRDFREGGSALGAIGTFALRDREVADGLGLRRTAVSGGADVRHRFRDGTVELRGNVLGSRVAGSPEAIRTTQRSSARYFQRPDAEHVSVDSTAASIQGWAGSVELRKVGGGPWRFGIATLLRSPGFEVNDVGFMTETDFITQAAHVGYFHNRPGSRLRSWRVGANAWTGWTFGGEHILRGGNVNGNVTFNNNWGAHGGVGLGGGTLSPTLLRGGPAMRTESEAFGWAGVSSDSRRDVQGSWNASWNVRPESGSWSLSLSPSLRWRPSERATIRVGPSVSRRVDDRQWVRRVTAEGGPRYLFGRMDQTTVAATLRTDLALTPDLSLQLYAEPFLSTGRFDRFREVTVPRAPAYADRFRPVDVPARDDGRVEAVLGGAGEPVSFGDPDFDVGRFRSNLVLRWEYRPGSTFYLVWGQARDDEGRNGSFRLGEGTRSLFREEPENVFMLKLSYWMNP